MKIIPLALVCVLLLAASVCAGEPPAIVFSDAFSDKGVDVDNDAEFNFLSVSLAAEVNEKGSYTFEIELYKDEELITAKHTPTVINFDRYGLQSLDFKIMGMEINKGGLNGSYVVKGKILDSGGEVEDTFDNYKTRKYDFKDFETPLIKEVSPVKGSILTSENTTFQVETGEDAICEYGFRKEKTKNVLTSANFSSGKVELEGLMNTTEEKTHVQELTGLEDDTYYHFVVECYNNEKGDWNREETFFFTGFSFGLEDVNMNVEGLTEFDTPLTGVREISFTDENGDALMDIYHNFTNAAFDIPDIEEIDKGEVDGRGYTLIKGLEIGEDTKAIYVENMLGRDEVCVKDLEVEEIGEISAKCDGNNETLLKCPGSEGVIECTKKRDFYKISGLKHSAAVEVDTTPPGQVIGLRATDVGETWINWNWTNPSDEDFKRAKIYLNEGFVEATTEEGHKSTGLASCTEYTLVVKTEDDYENSNEARVTTKTSGCKQSSGGGSSGGGLGALFTRRTEETEESEETTEEDVATGEGEEAAPQETEEKEAKSIEAGPLGPTGFAILQTGGMFGGIIFVGLAALYIYTRKTGETLYSVWHRFKTSRIAHGLRKIVRKVTTKIIDFLRRFT